MKQKPFEELTIADVTAKQCTSCAFFTVSPVGICVAPCSFKTDMDVRGIEQEQVFR